MSQRSSSRKELTLQEEPIFFNQYLTDYDIKHLSQKFLVSTFWNQVTEVTHKVFYRSNWSLCDIPNWDTIVKEPCLGLPVGEAEILSAQPWVVEPLTCFQLKTCFRLRSMKWISKAIEPVWSLFELIEWISKWQDVALKPVWNLIV